MREYKKYRSRYDVTYKILQVISDNPFILNGELTVKSNVSNNVLNKYMEAFVRHGIIDPVSLTRTGIKTTYTGYKISEIGMRALDKINNFIEQFGWINEINTYK